MLEYTMEYKIEDSGRICSSDSTAVDARGDPIPKRLYAGGLPTGFKYADTAVAWSVSAAPTVERPGYQHTAAPDGSSPPDVVGGLGISGNPNITKLPNAARKPKVSFNGLESY
ncbi:hypothetical protein ABW19_dt0200376 [Dactylella cylindrospora]|nr:hypothetical protein ABW19_dt0200376 [Dactylella cylindrospora]